MSSASVTFGPWPHRAAVLLVWCTFPLVWIGGLVTTTQSGMAVHDWPTTFGYNMFLYPLEQWLSGPFSVFIEHGHRLFASMVGLITIFMTLAVWRTEPRRWVRWLSVGVLAAVIFQGVIGGLRVRWDAQQLAMFHGCFAQAFFAMTITLAAVTSRWWQTAAESKSITSSLPKAAVMLASLAYLQVVLGAYLRHFRIGVVPHIFLALVLTGQAVWVLWLVWKQHRTQRLFTRPAMALMLLFAVQITLGITAWVTSRGWPSWFAQQAWAANYVVLAGSRMQIWSATAHVATGALILGTSVLLALRATRCLPLGKVSLAGSQAETGRLSAGSAGHVSSLAILGGQC